MKELTVFAGNEKFQIPIPLPKDMLKHIADENLEPIVATEGKLTKRNHGLRVHSEAIWDHDPQLFANDCYIGAAVIGSGVTLGSGCIVGDGAEIGHGCIIGSRVVIAPRSFHRSQHDYR